MGQKIDEVHYTVPCTDSGVHHGPWGIPWFAYLAKTWGLKWRVSSMRPSMVVVCTTNHRGLHGGTFHWKPLRQPRASLYLDQDHLQGTLHNLWGAPRVMKGPLKWTFCQNFKEPQDKLEPSPRGLSRDTPQLVVCISSCGVTLSDHSMLKTFKTKFLKKY